MGYFLKSQETNLGRSAGGFSPSLTGSSDLAAQPQETGQELELWFSR